MKYIFSMNKHFLALMHLVSHQCDLQDCVYERTVKDLKIGTCEVLIF